ncbi:MAG: penicillin-binding protein activator [Myxococcota bacterium]|jgi:ABC-type branched-subunit amino acid transport system substrate-binding protein
MRLIHCLVLVFVFFSVEALAKPSESILSKILRSSEEDLEEIPPTPIEDDTEPNEAEAPNGDETYMEDTEVVKADLCLLLPLSGQYGHIGQSVRSIFDRAFSVLEGVKVEVFDTKGIQVQQAVQSASRAGCAFLVGGLGDKEALAVANAADQARIPALILSGESDGRVRGAVIWGRASRYDKALVLARYLLEKGVTNAWTVSACSTNLCMAEAKAFTNAFLKLGGQPKMVDIDEDSEMQNEVSQFAKSVIGPTPEKACSSRAFVILGSIQNARRVLGFMEFGGLFALPKPSCKPPIVVAQASWAGQPELGRTTALDGAVYSAIKFQGVHQSSLQAELADLADLLVAAIQKDNLRDENMRYLIQTLRGMEPVPGRSGMLRIEGDKVTGQNLEIFEIQRGVGRPISAEAEWTNSD